jgi:hypothetical protein
LEGTLSEFIGVLQQRFPERFAHRPGALKKRVQSLIKTKMPPLRRQGGRPQQPYITRATELYQSQQRDVAAGRREGLNWVAIALEVMPGFAAIKHPYKRTIMLHRLRGAVYARMKRLRVTR